MAPLLSSRPFKLQVVLAAVIPALFGVGGGVLLGTSEPGYQALSLLAAVGGLGAGLEHLGVRSGLRRGLVGGSCFGLAILITHGTFFDGHPKAHVPEPEILLAVLTTAFGAGLGALGGRLRARLERTAPAAAVEAAEASRVPVPAAPAKPPVRPWEAMVDLNLATLEELLRLHPIGRGAAERILAYREAHGPFSAVTDLLYVDGFSPSRVARISERATVS